jgi:thiol-disulfide isomerase/thioredoxin
MPTRKGLLSKRMGRGASRGATCRSGNKVPRWMKCAAFGLIAVLVLILIYKYTIAPPGRMQEPYTDASEDTLVLLYMTGCGWCEKLMPTWDEFAEENDGKGLNFKKLEAKEPGAAKYKSHVTGYPTILLVKGSTGEIVKFEGARTVTGFKKFLKDNGVSVIERFVRRPESGSAKTLSKAKNTVTKHTNDPEQTAKISNSAGVKKEAA